MVRRIVPTAPTTVPVLASVKETPKSALLVPLSGLQMENTVKPADQSGLLRSGHQQIAARSSALITRGLEFLGLVDICQAPGRTMTMGPVLVIPASDLATSTCSSGSGV
jgi:hypothetical protein